MAERSYQTENVVIVVIDGPRYSESWGQSGRPNVRYMDSVLAPVGCTHSYFYNLGDSTKYSNLTSFHGEQSYLSQFLAGTHHEAVGNNAIRLKTNSGGDFSGTFSLYGVRGHE